jgi:hypothetical protein
MDQALAEYILTLAQAAANTHYAADRPLYLKYLADAAVLLAQKISGKAASELTSLVRDHDRLLGITWLQGPEHKAIFAAWQKVID